jgi:hypothetical protein
MPVAARLDQLLDMVKAAWASTKASTPTAMMMRASMDSSRVNPAPRDRG